MRDGDWRPILVLVAVAAGITIAWLDSRPGFDATGLTVFGLVITGFLVAIAARARAVGSAVLLGLVVGIWLPLSELGGSAGGASLAAIAFSVGGALVGALVVRTMRSGDVPVG